MIKKIIKVTSLILIPIVIVSYLLLMYNNYLDQQIDKLYNPALARTFAVDEMNKGIKILEHNANNDDLILLATSELATEVPQNPKFMFPNTELNCDVDLVGRAVVQNLANSIKVGALAKSFKGKKIVLIISLQWFFGDQVDKNGFKAHFSEIQFYKFMQNPDISKENKLYVCERITNLLKNDSRFERPYLYAKLYQKNNTISTTAFMCCKPYYYLREKFLELKDKHQALKAINQYKDCPPQDAININWEEEKVKAQKMGEDACTNNNFYVYDEYYDTYLKDNIEQSKNSMDPNTNLCASKEFDDYRLMLDTFKQAGVKPYIVFMSTNGFYYDYIGLDKNKRDAYYDKLGRFIEEYGFDYLDLRDKEYEPYFYKDVMHLGWKGWLYVNKQITKYFS